MIYPCHNLCSILAKGIDTAKYILYCLEQFEFQPTLNLIFMLPSCHPPYSSLNYEFICYFILPFILISKNVDLRINL